VRAVKLCSNKILQFLAVGAIVVVVVVVVVAVAVVIVIVQRWCR